MRAVRTIDRPCPHLPHFVRRPLPMGEGLQHVAPDSISDSHAYRPVMASEFTQPTIRDWRSRCPPLEKKSSGFTFLDRIDRPHEVLLVAERHGGIDAEHALEAGVRRAVHCWPPAVMRSAGMKVWPRPQGIGLRRSVCGLTRGRRHHITSSIE